MYLRVHSATAPALLSVSVPDSTLPIPSMESYLLHPCSRPLPLHFLPCLRINQSFLKMDKKAKKKWDQIYSETSESSITPAYVLKEYQYLLPKTGTALDIACGLGGNAILLAQQGLNTQAWDISEQAIQKLVQHCETNNIKLTAKVQDAHEHPPTANSFNVICVSYFLEREITEDLISALKPNGLLFYQTFIKESVSEHGPRNPNYRLDENELLKMFSSLHTLVYQELGRIGDTEQGLRDTAILVAQKRV